MDNKRGKSSEANSRFFLVLLLILIFIPLVSGAPSISKWLEDWDSVITGFVTGQTNISITISNVAPTLASATLNVTNITLLATADTINASITVTDVGDKINVTFTLFVNGVLNITNMSNNTGAGYDSGRIASYIFNNTNVTKDQNITVQFNATDGSLASAFVNSTYITVNNTGPVIGNITFQANSNPVTVTENSFETLTFYFLAHDIDGGLDNSSARANITNVNSSYISSNTSCINLSSPGPFVVNYSCTVDIWYFNLPGTWNITAQVNDSTIANLHQANQTQNTTWNFTIQDTTAIAVLSAISFPTSAPGADNITSTEDIRINNTGNHNTTGSAGLTVDVTGYTLRGVTDQLYNISITNFSISNNTGGTPPAECNSNAYGGGANQTTGNGTQIVIANGTLYPGNRTVNGEGNETLYVCIYDVPSELIAQDYVANGTQTWIVTVN